MEGEDERGPVRVGKEREGGRGQVGRKGERSLRKGKGRNAVEERKVK